MKEFFLDARKPRVPSKNFTRLQQNVLEIDLLSLSVVVIPATMAAKY